jgi:arylsulfatase A-like enzyme
MGRPALRKDAQAETRPGYMTTLLADEVIRSLGCHAAAREPFLMSLYFNAPHWPWEGPEDFALNNPGADYGGGSLETYARMTESLDMNIGRVLRKLDNLGLAQDTLVVFTSDNGGERFSETWPFQGTKGYLLEGGIRVPGIVRFPGRIPAGTTSRQMAITMDWMATVLDAAGVTPRRGQTLDGISLLPALSSGRDLPRSLFWRFQGHRQRAARIGNWKYYRLEDDEFLFDLSADSLERANKAPQAPETLAQLKEAWETWNSAMVTDDSIKGFCSSPHNLAGALPMGEGSNCKVGRPLPRAGD